jgi:hypothetical protein
MFARLHQRLRETGSLRPRHVGGGRRNVRTPESEEEVLERIANKPSTCTRAVAHAMGTSQSSVCRVLREQNLHAYHLQNVQGLRPGDLAPCFQFVQWFLQRSIADPALPAPVLFTGGVHAPARYASDIGA